MKIEHFSQAYQDQIRRKLGAAPAVVPAASSVAQWGRKGPNKTELEYRNNYLRGQDAEFEAISFRIAGHTYSPDWVVRVAGRPVECVEVKARGKNGFRQASYGRAMLAFDACRERWPGLMWTWAEKQGGQWRVQRFQVAAVAPSSIAASASCPTVAATVQPMTSK
jgi:hypothetical protein